MKPFHAVIAAAAVSFAPLFAQAAPAGGAPPEPAAIEASKELMVVMKTREMTTVALRQAEERMPGQMKQVMIGMVQNSPALDAGQKQQALAKIDKEAPAMAAQAHALYADPSLVDDIVAETVPLYARTYTVDELRQMAVFYRSPLGQKMLATMPQLMADCADISNRIMMPRIQKTMSQLVTRLSTN